MNRYPLWKNLLILGVILVGLVYALPNLFPQNPSIEITAARGNTVTEATLGEVKAVLENAGAPFRGVESLEGGKLLVRFDSNGDQLRGQALIEAALSDRYNSALTLSPDLPGWVSALGLQPMFLGLDLRGGIHVLIEVDMEAAVAQALERYAGDIRTRLREEKVRYTTVTFEGGRVLVKFPDAGALAAGEPVIQREFRELILVTSQEGGFQVQASLTPADELEI